jgi:RNA polymerase sigma-70 factor (ECF subfamily)
MIPDTSLGLIERLSRERFDEAAWEDFVNRYGTILVGWARRWGAEGNESHDLAQDVMLAMVRQMRDFRYDPSQSFRAWLKTVAWRALARERLKRRRCLSPGDDPPATLTDSMAAREDLLQLLEAQAERELLALAMERVRTRVKPHTWEAFELATSAGLDGAAIARRLGISISSVYVARHNVTRMLREEVTRLGGR